MILAWHGNDVMVSFICRGKKYSVPVRDISYKGTLGMEYTNGMGRITVATDVIIQGKELFTEIIRDDTFTIEIEPIVPNTPKKALVACHVYNLLTRPHAAIKKRILHNCKLVGLGGTIQASETIENTYGFTFEGLVCPPL